MLSVVITIYFNMINIQLQFKLTFVEVLDRVDDRTHIFKLKFFKDFLLGKFLFVLILVFDFLLWMRIGTWPLENFFFSLKKLLFKIFLFSNEFVDLMILCVLILKFDFWMFINDFEVCIEVLETLIVAKTLILVEFGWHHRHIWQCRDSHRAFCDAAVGNIILIHIRVWSHFTKFTHF